MTDCQIYGVKKNGETVLIGTSEMTAKMKAKELAEQYFGVFQYDDGSDGDLCLAAMEELIEHMKKTGWEFNFEKFIQPLS